MSGVHIPSMNTSMGGHLPNASLYSTVLANPASRRKSLMEMSDRELFLAIFDPTKSPESAIEGKLQKKFKTKFKTKQNRENSSSWSVLSSSLSASFAKCDFAEFAVCFVLHSVLCGCSWSRHHASHCVGRWCESLSGRAGKNVRCNYKSTKIEGMSCCLDFWVLFWVCFDFRVLRLEWIAK
jgi:hypothetical protein